MMKHPRALVSLPHGLPLALAAFGLGTFAACAAAAAADGPGRFDLPVDLRGRWTYVSSTGCEEYLNATGSSHFRGGAALCRALPTAGMETSIYQDCLEMTITGRTRMGGGGSPLHHMILDDEYVTDDWTAAGTPARWTSKIVPAGPDDVGAASAVVVFDAAASDGQASTITARRYIDEEGRLVQSWTAVAAAAGDGAEEATFRLVFEKAGDLPCRGYDPAECSRRTYEGDGEGAEGWTPACCLDDYGDHRPNPNERGCREVGPSSAEDSPSAVPAESPPEADGGDAAGPTLEPTDADGAGRRSGCPRERDIPPAAVALASALVLSARFI